MSEYITRTFSALLERSVALEMAVISKHLNPKDDKEYQRSVNREIKLTIKGVKSFSQRECLLLSILSHWLPPLTAFELQESLRSKFLKQEYFNFYSYLENKTLCLYKIYREDDYTLNDLFGNILILKRNIGIKDKLGNKSKKNN